MYKNIKPSYHSGLPQDQTTGEIETDQAINGQSEPLQQPNK